MASIGRQSGASPSSLLYRWAQGALPQMSDTERVAIEAGDVWWDAALFSGNPDWNALRAMPPAKLTDEEQAFLDGPVEQLCAMIDDWRVRFEWFDLPPAAWDFIKAEKFLGMIIPKAFGGLGFSPLAHSEVVRKLSTRSLTAAVTVMVPNSLGPGELLMKFGTEAQKQRYLPRLADGREIPCFGLTSLEAGSDAGAMTDTGVIAWGDYEGQRVLGMRLNWSKRYITLCPVATLIGLAFRLSDPDHLLGDQTDLGITLALVPATTPGVTTGHRHYPAHQVFQNGPTQGRDVFLPLDAIIGGQAQIGQGWRMLTSALAEGRGISLPSLSAAGLAVSARTAGAYARVREQFGLPIARFEGVAAALGRIAANAYVIDGARRLTCVGLGQHKTSAVIAAIMKAHATERMRASVNDALDIHGGKGVMDGPHNYMGDLYRAIPISITVEGANILTRNLMIFGQGAIRCHPYLLKEMTALANDDQAGFNQALCGHVGHAVVTLLRAFGRSWTRGAFAPRPVGGPLGAHYAQLSRYAAVLAFFSDMAFLSLGGGLKRKEMISARLGDLLSELYLLSGALKRFEDEGQQPTDAPVLDAAMADGLARMEKAMDEILANLPSRPMAWLMRAVAPGDAKARRGAGDARLLAAAAVITEPGPARDRLTPDLFLPKDDDGVARLERAFALAAEVEPLRQRLRHAKMKDWRQAQADGLVSTEEGARLDAAEAAVRLALAVDDFAPGELEARRTEPAAAKTQGQPRRSPRSSPPKTSRPQRRAPLPAAPPSI
ncbi:MAG TPA: acyl-CoA dehydrogenase [Caulobacteraceae bacterium]|nr:acyl-CoA dehydrogenase [Caulobacteraceae bacterium]